MDKYGLSYDCRENFIKSCDRLKEEKVDIVLGNHLTQNDSIGKAKRVSEGETEAFVDKTEWDNYIEGIKKTMKDKNARSK